MLQNAGGNGRVAILGVSGIDSGAESRFLQAGASQVIQLAINQANADLQATYDAIAACDVVWMRGGNQANYVQWWNNTKTEAAIRAVFDKGGAVGGTSAGCAVLGEIIYDSITGSVSPKAAIRDPYSTAISFTSDFLELTPGVLFDTHFTERGRIARLAVMLGRLWQDQGQDVLGVGCDDRTAFCVAPDGTARVIGEGAVTVLHRTTGTRQALLKNLPAVITDLEHVQLTEGYVYDLTSRSVINRPSNALLVGAPDAIPDFAQLQLNGSSALDAAAGEYNVVDNGNDLALFNGALQVLPGSGFLQDAVVSTRCWDSTAFDENRVGGPQYALALHPHRLAVFLDGGVNLLVRADERLTPLPAAGTESPLLVLDSYGVKSVAFSTYQSSGSAQGPRQSVALEGCRLHLIRSGMSYDAALHGVDSLNAYGSGFPGCAGAHTLTGFGQPNLGNSAFALRTDGGAPNGVGLVGLASQWDFAGSDPLALGLPLHLSILSPFLSLLPFSADGSGLAQVALPIPANPNLAGQTYYAQALWVWLPGSPCQPSPSGFSSSPGLALTLL
jgi:cyanophycinase